MKRTWILFAVFFVAITTALFVSCTNSTNGTNGQGSESKDKIARFDYFKYEGKDAWFDKKIDPKNQYYNPVISGFYPDPSICRKGDTYYLIHSSFSFFPGVPIFTSKDLVNWEQIGHVLDRPSQFNVENQEISAGIFAPAIEYNPNNDTFYMITTFAWGIGNFYVKTKDPMKGWSDPILLPEVQGIDPSFYFDENGKGYIVHNDAPDEGKALYDGHRVIKIWEFDVENDKVVPNSSKIIVDGGVDISQKPIWIEAPHLYKINGHYYLMCAEGGTGGWHSEVIFRSNNPMGPFKPAAYNPILTQRDLPEERENKITCAGHADIVQTPEGDWWAVFLASRPYEGGLFNTGREAFLLPITWENEFPIILPKGQQIPTVIDKEGLTGNAKYLTGNFVYDQEFNDAQLDYSWIFIRTPKQEFYTIKDGKLNITPLAISIEEKKSPSVILRRQQHTDFAVETQLEYTPKTSNDFAGFTLFQKEENQFLFGKTIIDGKESLVVYRMEKDKKVMATIPIDKKNQGSSVKLKIEGKGRYCDFLYSFDGVDWKKLVSDADASNLSTEKSGGFVGVCIGLYATSNHTMK